MAEKIKNSKNEKSEKVRIGTISLFNKAMSTLSTNDIRLKIALLIKEDKKLSFTEIKMKYNLNNNNLRFHLKKLVEAHIISQSYTRGPYEITELGETLIRFFELLEGELHIKVGKDE